MPNGPTLTSCYCLLLMLALDLHLFQGRFAASVTLKCPQRYICEMLSSMKILCQTQYRLGLSWSWKPGDAPSAYLTVTMNAVWSWLFSVTLTFCSLDTCFLESTYTRNLPVCYIEHFSHLGKFYIEKTQLILCTILWQHILGKMQC